MYQNIDFTETGGFPLTQNVMAFIQNSYNNVLAAISRSFGDYVILSGITQTSPNVYSNGWITFAGEIVPFVGGINTGFISVTQTAQTVTFRDTTLKQVIFSRNAVFSNSGITFSTFKKINVSLLVAAISAATVASASAVATANGAQIIAISAQTIANNALTIANAAKIPSGIILMWKGSVATIPAGFFLCNGGNGTPDLRDRFIVGAGNSYLPAAIGGENFHTLSSAEMPNHDHATHGGGPILGGGGSGPWFLSKSSNRYSGSGSDQFGGSISPDITMRTGAAGIGNPHENRPPYYALCYIMKS